jgi:hypothetical protein
VTPIAVPITVISRRSSRGCTKDSKRYPLAIAPVAPATMMVATIVVGVMAIVVPAMASIRVRGRDDSRDGQDGSQRRRCDLIAHFAPHAFLRPPFTLISENSCGLVLR